MVSRGSTARATSMTRCGDSPVLGVLSASTTCSRNVLAAFSPQPLPSGASSASAASNALSSPTISGSAGTKASRLGVEASEMTGKVYGQALGCSSTASSPTVTIRSAWVTSAFSIMPPMMQPARNG